MDDHEGKDPREPDQKPVKRRGTRKPRRPNQGREEALPPSSPPGLASVHELFGEDAGTASKAGIEIPRSGKNGKENDDRTRIRVDTLQMGKRWSEIYSAVEAGEYTWEEFVQSLTPAELARGTLMAEDGTFRGRPPKMVPRAFLNACTKELMARGAALWKENYVQAIEAMTEIAKSPDAKPGDRIKAAQFVIERLEGKVPQVVQVSVEDPWQVALDGMVAEVSEEAAISRAHDYSARERAMRSMEDPEA